MPVTDEDIVRDLLHRCTDGVQPHASIAAEVVARQRRRDRRRRAVSLAATGAVVGTAAAVIAVVPGHGSRAPGTPSLAIRLTAEQRTLYTLSSVAASQPAGHGRYVVMATEGHDVKDTSVIDSLTGDLWSYQQGTHGNPSGTGPVTRHYSPTAARLAAMPASPAALRAALITQWNAQNEPAPFPRRAKAAAGRPVPRSSIRVDSGDKVFQQATNLLWNPLAGPALRSELLKVLATVPGVTVSSSARDAIGHRAVEISRTDTSGFPGGKSDHITYATYESPATGAVLETAITYPPGSDLVTPQDPHGTATVVDVTVYLSITRSSTIPADPYGRR